MLNLIGCTSLRYAVIRSKPGRIRQFPGPDTPRFKEVSGDQIFLATEKVRIGKNTVPDTRQTRRVSWNMILPDLPVFSKNTGPYRGISGPRHVFFHAVCSILRGDPRPIFNLFRKASATTDGWPNRFSKMLFAV